MSPSGPVNQNRRSPPRADISSKRSAWCQLSLLGGPMMKPRCAKRTIPLVSTDSGGTYTHRSRVNDRAFRGIVMLLGTRPVPKLITKKVNAPYAINVVASQRLTFGCKYASHDERTT